MASEEAAAAEPAIVAQAISKDFVLPHERAGSVKQAFTGLFRKGSGGAEVQHALRNISFEIKKGEFFGIVGRNGSGKSTLLKILAGIYQPTKGNVHIDGKLVPFIELGVGFNPELTGRENVFLNGALLGFSTKEVEAMYDEIVAFAELSRFMDQKLKNYSSGMQVRLAFSLAIRAKADILLIDEVLAVGDADFQRKCFRYFRELKKSNTTVVLVTHDMDAVREYCDRGILINKSRIVAEGTANDIANQYIRLFNQEQAEEAAEGEEQAAKRWGNNKARILSCKMSQRKGYDDSDDISFTVEIEAKADLNEPVTGFMVRNESEAPVVGTNTRIKQRKLGSLKKGQRVSVTWTMPNVLPDGTYVIDPAVVEDDLVTACDWWNGAATFEVRRLHRTPYPMQPKIDVEVKQ